MSDQQNALSVRDFKAMIIALRYAQQVGVEQALAEAESGLEGARATSRILGNENEVWMTTAVKYV